MRTVTINGASFTLDREMVENALASELPEPIRDHYVVVAGRRFPPKQVITAVTGLDRADFTTHQARRILTRLGITASRASQRREERPPDPCRGPHGGREADALRPFLGKWVAQRGLDVIVAADTPGEVVRWLNEHHQQADVMFRVPRSEEEAQGAAPL